MYAIVCFSCTNELSIYLIDNHLINAVSEAVILSTLSYQEAWEMVMSLFLNMCSHYSFSAFTNVEHGDTTMDENGLFNKNECFTTLKSLIELELLAGNGNLAIVGSMCTKFIHFLHP